MSYRSLNDCVKDLEKHGKLLRIKSEVDPNLEMAEIHRRIFDAKGPAILYENVKGSPFRALSNLYGTKERTRFLFRHTLENVQKVIALKIDPIQLLKNPGKYWKAPFTALTGLPQKARFSKPILFGETTISALPQIKSWGMDGGAFVTLPQVFSMGPDSKDIMKSNLGMYRIQLSGNDYQMDKEVGLHYQLHRGIGVHHKAYNDSDKPFKVSVFIGGPPSNAFSAIMPLPENLSELTFAGLLNGHRFRYFEQHGHTLSADADFCITGTVVKNKKMREGPFGDHLGYYSLEHDFPVLEVDKVYHRKDAIWHFTVVGRPPAEDSNFGYLIHELVKELAPQEFPGLKDINAVDAAGVHPLLLAIGSERYMPFRERRPEEILTIANHLLGKGQTTLAKYLFIADHSDDPKLDTHHIEHYFNHILERVDWTRDLHFQTKTTIDTLDYSGDGWNSGSKLVVACCGDKKRSLDATLPENFDLPIGFSKPKFVQKGILAIQAPPYTDHESGQKAIRHLESYLERYEMEHIPMVLVVDDSDFVTQTLNNFVWVTFTRSNPSHDIHGLRSFVEHKHWGCRGSLIFDARIKPHHAPPLIVDEKVKLKVDKLFSKGGELYKKA
ncbi:MAG: 3-polyprenyl-4-hydroxybenzoate carboxy-lyase (EC [uncultured Aureispira sp.]|uniref:3-polyprenyl-4-hydroxybenzoate carboxy-lyase (EC) n=1 Tax=uncultured Aureispira sp. TaxID=1331704 RepID=A0A6S6TFF2_9BACT|nr:MAG: 3-polyprenyl-4-hydroxybenzoate carboxy-lyase (EC [uncultured Aureispira sp.]